MALNVALFPDCNSVPFSPDEPTFPGLVTQDSYANTIQDWQAELPYLVKVGMTDTVNVLVHTNFFSFFPIYSPTLSILDKYKNVISTINLNIAPYWKGWQFIGTNILVNPYNKTDIIPLQTNLWSFSFADLMLEEGTYYLQLRNNNQFDSANYQYYTSEPMSVMNSFDDTNLISFTYNTNNFKKNIIITGWFQDYPTNTSPFNPVFSQRIEGYMIPIPPKVINIGYQQQLYQQLQIQTQQLQFWKLTVGEVSIGIPFVMLTLITEALLADIVYINIQPNTNAGYLIIIYNPQGSSQTADLWKVKTADLNPLLFGEIVVMTKYNSQRAFITPGPPVSGRLHGPEFNNLFN